MATAMAAFLVGSRAARAVGARGGTVARGLDLGGDGDGDGEADAGRGVPKLKVTQGPALYLVLCTTTTCCYAAVGMCGYSSFLPSSLGQP